MPAITIKTGCWFDKLPDQYLRVGISRGIPRRTPAGYRMFRKLAPGPWFNRVGVNEYRRLYKAEILSQLDPLAIAAELVALDPDRTPVLLCYEFGGHGEFCHRALAAEWLSVALGQPVPEFGHEHLDQAAHPLLPVSERLL